MDHRQPFPFHHSLRVRYAEVDAQAVVYFAMHTKQLPHKKEPIYA